MSLVSVVCDAARDSEDIRKSLGDTHEIEFVEFETLRDIDPGHLIVVDIDLKRITRLLVVKEWLKCRPKDSRVFVVADKSSRLDTIRAHAIGASEVIHRPIDGRFILSKLEEQFLQLADGSPELAKSKDAAATLEALQQIFSSACLGEPINTASISAASEPVIRHIETEGLASWIETVRQHHSQTYQHSLLVTGVAVAFGLYLGFSKIDRERLSFAGMLHDVGKAQIPIGILEKPGALDAEEMKLMQRHPEYGVEMCKKNPEIDPRMIDMVLHHHEYLDGSGYPHRLQKREISDFVRIMTISDIFAALIERRAYRPALTNHAAYKIMLDMGPKLDRDLLREFGFVSHLRLQAD